MNPKEKINELPFVPTVKEEITKAVETRAKNEEMHEDELDSLLAGLRRSVQVYKHHEGYFFSRVVDGSGSTMQHEDGEEYSIADFVSNFDFNSGSGDNKNQDQKTIREGKLNKNQMNAAGVSLEDIASGKVDVDRRVHSKVDSHAVPASDTRAVSANLEDIASGKRVVDMGS